MFDLDPVIGWAFILLAIGMYVAAAMFHRWSGGVDGKFTSLDAKFTSLDGKFTSLDAKFTSLDGKFTSLDGKFTSLESKLSDFAREVRQMFTRRSPTLDSASPLVLNDLGKTIAVALKAEQWATGLAPLLMARTAGMQPFEIDDFCLQYIRIEIDPEWRPRIAASAYENGVDRAAVEDVMRVVLRDELLKRASRSTP